MAEGITTRGPNAFVALAVVISMLMIGAASAGAAELKWSFEKVGEGIKPAIALDAGGTPHITYLTEAMRGAAFYTTNKSGEWKTEKLAEGYFYGPIDIDVTSGGEPYITYHDHQATGFNPRLGAGVVAARNGGAWELTTIKDRGHDQWDADIAVEDNGNWHVAGIDPSQFGSQDGLEYITNAFGGVKVEQVGSGPQPYEFAVSIEVGPGGVVGISYFDASSADLRYAERGPGASGAWTLTTVDGAGDAGRYSSLAYDSNGAPHISYMTLTGRGSGTVRHAWRDGGAWKTEDVGTLDNIQAGMTGARKITAIALDADDNLGIMFSDRAVVKYASRENGAWASSTVFENKGNKLGQLVEFALDSDALPHVTFFELTSGSGPLFGDILYGRATN